MLDGLKVPKSKMALVSEVPEKRRGNMPPEEQ